MSDDGPAPSGGEGAPEPVRPLLRVVRGEPTPDELAALVAVVAAAAGGSDEPPPRPRHGRWSDPAAGLRTAVVVGPGAWQATARVPGVMTGAGW